MIYLDHNSSTRPCSSAIERMNAFLQENYASMNSCHRMGQDLLSAVNSRIDVLKNFVDADCEDQFVFTSNGAEAISQVFFSVFLEKARKEGKCQIIISELEDLATFQSAKRLEELGCYVKIAKVDASGMIDLEELKKLINPRTALISCSVACGLTGVIQPFEKIIEIAKDAQVLLHLDATNAIGKFPICFRSDYMTFSGDRIHSVKSSGALFVKKGVPVSSLIHGVQNGILRGGSFDVASFMALSAAILQAELYLDVMSMEVVRLRDLFESNLNGQVQYQNTLRLPNTTAIKFENVHHEALLYLLNRKGVYASIGDGYMRVLEEDVIHFSISRMTTEEELEKASQIINDCVQQLQKIAGKV